MDYDAVALDARSSAVVVEVRAAQCVGWIVAGDDHRSAKTLSVLVATSADY